MSRRAATGAIAGLVVLVCACGQPRATTETITGNDSVVSHRGRTYQALATDLTSIGPEDLAPVGIAAEANRGVYPDPTMYRLAGVDPTVAFVMKDDTGQLLVLVRDDVQFQFQPVLCEYWHQDVAPCLSAVPSTPGPS